jgi:hypothetical protein
VKPRTRITTDPSPRMSIFWARPIKRLLRRNLARPTRTGIGP